MSSGGEDGFIEGNAGERVSAAGASSDDSKEILGEEDLMEQSFPLVIRKIYPYEKRLLLKRRRILDRMGKPNVFNSGIPRKYYRYAKDLGNTLITIRWRWILLSLCIANGIAWLLFAFIWMAVAVLRGDSDKEQSDVCIIGTQHFTGYLLLSIETLTTIGFGEIYPANCTEGWLVLTLQALTGVAIEGALVTAVYVKMSRPSAKHPYDLFSKKGVICLRDGKFCLVFRVYDEHGKFWAKTKIRAYFIQRRVTNEKEVMDNYVNPLVLQKFGLIMLPYEIVHVIDNEASPLWDFSAKDLLVHSFEIVLTIRGDSITTGQPSECKTSYTNKDILWGSRFKECTEYDEGAAKYIFRRDNFNATAMYDIPLCSALRYNECGVTPWDDPDSDRRRCHHLHTMHNLRRRNCLCIVKYSNTGYNNPFTQTLLARKSHSYQVRFIY